MFINVEVQHMVKICSSIPMFRQVSLPLKYRVSPAASRISRNDGRPDYKTSTRPKSLCPWRVLEVVILKIILTKHGKKKRLLARWEEGDNSKKTVQLLDSLMLTRVLKCRKCEPQASVVFWQCNIHAARFLNKVIYFILYFGEGRTVHLYIQNGKRRL